MEMFNKIIFVSKDKDFISLAKKYTSNAYCMDIKDLKKSDKFVYFYFSPANSLCFMDGGIDYTLSREIMPGVEQKLRSVVQKHGYTSLLGRKYLPIGSCCLIDYDDNNILLSCPTMLLPQDVSETKNCYYATMAALYAVQEYYEKNEKDEKDFFIVMTSACCGYGKMDVEQSLCQCFQAIRDYKIYGDDATMISHSDGIILLKEPNMEEQPHVYANTEWLGQSIMFCEASKNKEN